MTDKQPIDYTTLTDKQLLALCTDKQRIFISKYLVKFNGSQSAIDAGFSIESSRVIAYEILTKPYIKELKDRKVKEIIAQTDDKRAKLIQFWDSVIDDLEASEQAKQKASDSMAKYLAMFTENIHHSGEINTVYLDKQDEGV